MTTRLEKRVAQDRYTPITIGRALRKIREESRLSQRGFGEASGLTHVTVSRIEAGRCHDFRTLAKAMGAAGYELRLSMRMR